MMIAKLERTPSTAKQHNNQTENHNNGSNNKQRNNSNGITALKQTAVEATVNGNQ